MSRKEGEEIVIGDNIRVMIVEIRGDKVRLGVTAPADMPVHRKDVWQKIQEDQKNKE